MAIFRSVSVQVEEIKQHRFYGLEYYSAIDWHLWSQRGYGDMVTGRPVIIDYDNNLEGN